MDGPDGLAHNIQIHHNNYNVGGLVDERNTKGTLTTTSEVDEQLHKKNQRAQQILLLEHQQQIKQLEDHIVHLEVARFSEQQLFSKHLEIAKFAIASALMQTNDTCTQYLTFNPQFFESVFFSA